MKHKAEDISPLITAQSTFFSSPVRIKALRMISEENPTSGFITCTKLFGDKDCYVRLAAYHLAKSCVKKLNEEDTLHALKLLYKLLDSDDSWVRRNAIESLAVLILKEDIKDDILKHIKNHYERENYIYVRKRIEKLFLNGNNRKQKTGMSREERTEASTDGGF